MPESLKLMGIFAHPDDESLGVGGAFARYASEGIDTHLLCATRGERGWFGDPRDNPGLEALGRIRERELRAAAAVLGIQSVDFLGYVDGELDQANPREAIEKIAAHLRRLRPQVVITFGPDGVYGHPDHIAISQLTTAAIVRAASQQHAQPGNPPPHSVSKLYYFVDTGEISHEYEALMGELAIEVDGIQRRPVGWEKWAITTCLDTSDHWQTVWEAISCHRTQLPAYATLAQMNVDQHKRLWGRQTFYRASSLVNGGRHIEHDLFDGLRPAHPSARTDNM
jgi:LmbE family N-acetylglucosaminyl deacetylase